MVTYPLHICVHDYTPDNMNWVTISCSLLKLNQTVVSVAQKAPAVTHA